MALDLRQHRQENRSADQRLQLKDVVLYALGVEPVR